jgi:hypothetical protein
MRWGVFQRNGGDLGGDEGGRVCVDFGWGTEREARGGPHATIANSNQMLPSTIGVGFHPLLPTPHSPLCPNLSSLGR